MDKEIICSFCGDPIEGFAIEGPTGSLICLDCVNILIQIVTDEAIQQQAGCSKIH